MCLGTGEGDGDRRMPLRSLEMRALRSRPSSRPSKLPAPRGRSASGAAALLELSLGPRFGGGDDDGMSGS